MSVLSGVDMAAQRWLIHEKYSTAISDKNVQGTDLGDLF